MSAIELVKNCPLFFELYDDEVLKFIKHCQVEVYQSKSHITKYGEEGDCLFIILDGKVDVYIPDNDKKIHITSLKEGDFFGELVLINELKRNADVIASNEVSLLIISIEHFFSYFDKNSKVFSLMVLNISRLLTKRLKNSNQIIADLKKSKSKS